MTTPNPDVPTGLTDALAHTQVIHDANAQCFYLSCQGEQALLQYHQHGQRVDFYRTFVPATWRGQGIAARLAEQGLTWARQQQLVISASCSYIARLLP
jgi:hypothetical protein